MRAVLGSGSAAAVSFSLVCGLGYSKLLEVSGPELKRLDWRSPSISDSLRSCE